MRVESPAISATPTEIKLHQVSKLLEISFDDGNTFKLPYEYLRVYTPSAEAVGHGPGQEVLQAGKAYVSITELKPVGNYAVAPVFSDGHNSGIYTWALLYKLGSDQQHLWQNYLDRLKAAGLTRGNA
ncbi:MAG: 1-(5-phosphoribosyl)-5-((5-phosphoribosylamino)methylideneamino)imidazole-4-carboxamide isomerase [Gammaproteobacteria bacterium HGW-Gammaproteobacteria-3]|nr:MAG: 1-(5-phosphoribosyl)-5-((5-phosphoribosylamino)methylideneamino)imidazole-4-carboxamide isomerase [Gammaproteobacteria bacterium HGW-Gammaproteobacteria-3]